MPSNTMSKLKLEPEEVLQFSKQTGGSNPTPTRVLKLTNIDGGNVAFKVKTTAPKSYLVRPSSGTLKPRDTQEVQIIFQPQQCTDGAANNHRFLVQAVSVATEEGLSRDDWAAYSKENIQEHRLSVVLTDARQVDEQAAPTRPPTETLMAKPGVSENSGDLKMKYDELVAYTLLLEKEKKKIEEELSLQRKKGGGGGSSEGYTGVQLMIVALLVFLLSYMAKFFPDMMQPGVAKTGA